MNLQVLFNNKVVMQAERDSTVPGQLRSFFDRMDADMDNGIVLDNNKITKPDTMQRAHYVIANFIYALHNDNTELMNMLCQYLAHRLPELKQVHALEQGDDLTTRLVFDE